MTTQEPDLEKKRKRRRRSARAYVNVDKLTPEEIRERLAAVAEFFPPDSDDGDDDQSVAKPDRVKRHVSQSERKRLAREGNALVGSDGHISYPIASAEDLQNAADHVRLGHGDVEGARKLIARRAKELGVANPLESSEKSYMGNAFPGETFADRRVSEPLTAGRASPSSGDHGVGAGRNPGLAAHHGDLRQSSPSAFEALSRLQAVLGDNQYGDRSITRTAGEVGLTLFNAAGQAGAYSGMQARNPDPLRPESGIARGSATPPNGSHSTGNATRPPTQAMKWSEAFDIMKRHNFPGSGGRR